MPHLHLSLQAGDDMILKRMKRRHLRDDAIALLEELPRAAPGHRVRRRHHRRLPDRDRRDVRELAEDLVEDCGLTFLHVFPYFAAAGHAGGAHAASWRRQRSRRDHHRTCRTALTMILWWGKKKQPDPKTGESRLSR
jgi:tRNA A37 methylthiotransferase MiaB